MLLTSAQTQRPRGRGGCHPLRACMLAAGAAEQQMGGDSCIGMFAFSRRQQNLRLKRNSGQQRSGCEVAQIDLAGGGRYSRSGGGKSQMLGTGLCTPPSRPFCLSDGLSQRELDPVHSSVACGHPLSTPGSFAPTYSCKGASSAHLRGCNSQEAQAKRGPEESQRGCHPPAPAAAPLLDVEENDTSQIRGP